MDVLGEELVAPDGARGDVLDAAQDVGDFESD
jgi:hypothetical protein